MSFGGSLIIRFYGHKFGGFFGSFGGTLTFREASSSIGDSLTFWSAILLTSTFRIGGKASHMACEMQLYYRSSSTSTTECFPSIAHTHVVVHDLCLNL